MPVLEKGVSRPRFAWGAEITVLVKIFPSAVQAIADLGSEKHLTAKVYLQFLLWVCGQAFVSRGAIGVASVRSFSHV